MLKLNYKRRRGGFTLIELLIVVAILGVLAAISVPQFARYRKSAMDTVAQNAYHAVAVAQEAQYVYTGEYTTDYGVLVQQAGLVIDKNIFYGTITLVLSTDPPTFTFSLNHKTPSSTTYTYSTSAANTVTTGGTRIDVNDATVPSSS
ncbi:MAG: type II secretion system GspH family protein [Deltaproteobacteria bacterium]|jgi:prepilin-type N-terminal cleavage/methylation domain-containing protein|nr:type II secretion system GspH family protein [Deltaproteobacteria bacterium]